MNPLLIQIGYLQVHWYGLLIVTGAVLAAWLATKEAKRRGEDPDHVWNLLIWVIFGIIGARLYHVFSTPAGNFVGWSYYREHPIDIIAFWNGGFRGLGIYGAVRRRPAVGSTPAHRLNFRRWLDIATPGCCWRRPSAAWEISSTRSSTARRPTCPGRFTSTRLSPARNQPVRPGLRLPAD